MDKHRKYILKKIHFCALMWAKNIHCRFVGISPRHDKSIALGVVIFTAFSVIGAGPVSIAAGLSAFIIGLNKFKRESYIDVIYRLLETYEPLEQSAFNTLASNIQRGNIHPRIFLGFIQSEMMVEPHNVVKKASDEFLTRQMKKGMVIHEKNDIDSPEPPRKTYEALSVMGDINRILFPTFDEKHKELRELVNRLYPYNMFTDKTNPLAVANVYLSVGKVNEAISTLKDALGNDEVLELLGHIPDKENFISGLVARLEMSRA
ncbi:MAG: hypothetical protein ACTS9Y_01265 [Methylophilus sp.]|uniref:hypothetical protein n=1 Tax=Methylophilus sp. TaxID=29541 RepID=UPI003F9EC43A